MTLPPPAQLTHVGLYVDDMDTMVAFYGELLGLVVTDRGELFGRELTFLSRDPEEHHQLVLVTGRRRATRRWPVLSQLSFRLDDDDLASAPVVRPPGRTSSAPPGWTPATTETAGASTFSIPKGTDWRSTRRPRGT